MSYAECSFFIVIARLVMLSVVHAECRFLIVLIVIRNVVYTVYCFIYLMSSVMLRVIYAECHLC